MMRAGGDCMLGRPGGWGRVGDGRWGRSIHDESKHYDPLKCIVDWKELDALSMKFLDNFKLTLVSLRVFSSIITG